MRLHAQRISQGVACRSQENLMRAGIRLAQTNQVVASGSFLASSFFPFKGRMSTAAAAEPAATSPEPKQDVAAPAGTVVESAAIPELPDASSDPVVAGVLKRFVQQYETKDTKEQVRCTLFSAHGVVVHRSTWIQVEASPMHSSPFVSQHVVALMFFAWKRHDARYTQVHPPWPRIYPTAPKTRFLFRKHALMQY